MIEILLLFTAIAGLKCENETKFSALVFVSLCFFYNEISEFIESNSLYYILAATTDLLIIFIISKLTQLNKEIKAIQSICLLFVYANLNGFIIYHFELPSIIYSLLCGSLFFAALTVVLFGGSHGNNRDNIRSGDFHLFNNPSSRSLRGDKATRTN